MSSQNRLFTKDFGLSATEIDNSVTCFKAGSFLRTLSLERWRCRMRPKPIVCRWVVSPCLRFFEHFSSECQQIYGFKQKQRVSRLISMIVQKDGFSKLAQKQWRQWRQYKTSFVVSSVSHNDERINFPGSTHRFRGHWCLADRHTRCSPNSEVYPFCYKSLFSKK